MAARFKLHSIGMLIAFLALILAVVVVSIENRRLRRELAVSQQRQEFFLDEVDVSRIDLFVHAQPTPPAQAERMPDGVDAFAQPSKD
jgi:hypothetical protein